MSRKRKEPVFAFDDKDYLVQINPDRERNKPPVRRKIRVRIKIRPYLKRVETKYGKKQRVIRAHSRAIIKNFDTLAGKEELAKQFFIQRFMKSPEQNPKESERWKERNLGSHPVNNDEIEFIEEKMKENERRRKFGLEDQDEERLLGEGSSDIVKEKGGLALIRHHDSYSPASESPTMFEIRDDEGNTIWKEGITYMGEFAFQGLGPFEVSQSQRKDAEQQFEKLLKKRKNFGSSPKTFLPKRDKEDWAEIKEKYTLATIPMHIMKELKNDPDFVRKQNEIRLEEGWPLLKEPKQPKNYGSLKRVLRQKEGTILHIPHSLVSTELDNDIYHHKQDFITLPITPQNIINELRKTSPKDFAEASISRRQAKEAIIGKSKLENMTQDQIIQDFIRQREDFLKNEKKFGSLPKNFDGFMTDNRLNISKQKFRKERSQDLISKFEDIKKAANDMEEKMKSADLEQLKKLREESKEQMKKLKQVEEESAAIRKFK